VDILKLFFLAGIFSCKLRSLKYQKIMTKKLGFLLKKITFAIQLK